ncbi:hypothetical protein ACUNV4_30020 [Granulosicoccus sp. 3-233]|uniref:hypothetical protein n=1 Tax=Granulosicoccus sp. 3-233 TaxID=3417969 RepID=UPI003D328526
MSTLAQRNEILELVDEAVSSGARHTEACKVIGIAASTLRRWRPAGGAVQADCRPTADRPVPFGRFSDEERQRIVDTCNRPEYASLPPSQIVPALADQGQYIGSESTIYRELKRIGQLAPRGRAKVRQKRKPPTTHLATAINQVWMLDVTWRTPGIRGEQDARTGSRVCREYHHSSSRSARAMVSSTPTKMSLSGSDGQRACPVM